MKCGRIIEGEVFAHGTSTMQVNGAVRYNLSFQLFEAAILFYKCGEMIEKQKDREKEFLNQMQYELYQSDQRLIDLGEKINVLKNQWFCY